MNMLKFILWGINQEIPKLLRTDGGAAIRGIMAVIAAVLLILIAAASLVYGYMVDDLELVLVGGVVLFIVEFGLGWATRLKKSDH